MQDFVVCFIIVVCKKWSENSHALASNRQVGDKTQYDLKNNNLLST